MLKILQKFQKNLNLTIPLFMAAGFITGLLVDDSAAATALCG
jgi:hypothetical protein